MTMTAAAGMSAAGLPPPPELLRVQFPLLPPYWDIGEQPIFQTWWMHFENYIYWTNAQRGPNQLASEYKNRLLFSLLGSEGTNRFASNPFICQLATATFDDFSAEVKKFFQPSINVLRAHYDFTMRRQKDGETVAEYLSALWTLLVDCHIPSADEQHRAIANQLVVGCRDKATLQKLFVVGEPDFNHVYQIMEAEERMTMDASVVHGGAASKFGALSSHSPQSHATTHKPNRQSPKDPGTQGPSPGASSTTCTNCGRHGHSARDQSCPARNQDCNSCHKRGHFERCCRAKKGGKGKQARLRIRVVDDPSHLTDAIIGTVELDCKESSVPVSFSAELDSGSQCTAVTHSVFNWSFPRDILRQPTQSLINFDGSPVNCVQGYFTTKAHFEDCTCSTRVYILDNTCAPVIGWDLMTRLGMHLDCGTGQVCCMKGSSRALRGRLVGGCLSL